MPDTIQEGEQLVLLLDNNLIQYSLSPECGSDVWPFLEATATQNNATLSISDIVIFEALKSIIFKTDKRQAVADFIDNNLVRYPVSHEVLIGAAQLHDMYGSDEYIRSYMNSISSEDLIIGVTAITTNGYIVTTNCKDFPEPFFDVADKRTFHFKDVKQKPKHIVTYIIKPDLMAINEIYNSLEPNSDTPQQ